jgi:hypothetical protein
LVHASQGAFEGRIGSRFAVLHQQTNDAGETRKYLAVGRWQLRDLVAQGMITPLKEGGEETVILCLYQTAESRVELAGLITEEIDAACRPHNRSFVVIFLEGWI